MTITFHNYSYDYHIKLEEEVREQELTGTGINESCVNESNTEYPSEGIQVCVKDGNNSAPERDNIVPPTPPEVSYRIVVYINGIQDISVEYRDMVIGEYKYVCVL